MILSGPSGWDIHRHLSQSILTLIHNVDTGWKLKRSLNLNFPTCLSVVGWISSKLDATGNQSPTNRNRFYTYQNKSGKRRPILSILLIYSFYVLILLFLRTAAFSTLRALTCTVLVFVLIVFALVIFFALLPTSGLSFGLGFCLGFP